MTKVEKVSGARAHTRYYVNGKRVPGVTTILGVLDKHALVKWANNLGLQGIDSSKYTDKLAQVGTLAHYLIECHLSGQKPDLTAYSPEQIDLASNSVLKFHAWEAEHTVEPIMTEAQLVSEQYRFGGTVDFYGLIDGVPTILDLKTSKAIYPEHIHQVAAYRWLLNEAGHPVEQVRVLQIGRDESEGFSERVLTVDELQPHWEVFLHCRALYDLRKEAV